MRVALLNTTDYGGAARAALRLSKGLQEEGEQVDFFVKYKKTDFEFVRQIKSPATHNEMIEYIAQKYFYQNIFPGNTMLSPMYPSLGFDFAHYLKAYDIIHLHWIATFMSMESIAALGQTKKPLLWTLHDQNPFTGACHYTHGCKRYEVSCEKCPQMKKPVNDITKNLLLAKWEHMPPELIVISPSKWMAECAKKSRVFRKNRIEVIPNSVELDIFDIKNRDQAKAAFGFSEKTKIILFGAENHQEKRKGFAELVQAMKAIKVNNLEIPLAILAFGNESEEIKNLGFPYKSLGYVNNDQILADAYSAADVVALPSLEDNLPNIILEAFACGTPVVAFATGGMPDFIVNGETGYTVPTGDSQAFAEALQDILSINKQLGINCRSVAERNFSMKKQAQAYLDLYGELYQHRSYQGKGNNLMMFPEVADKLAPFFCEAAVFCQDKIEHLNTLEIELQRQIEVLLQECNYFKAERADFQKRIDYLIKERNELCQKNKKLLNSHSWKLSKPLRAAGRFLKKFRR